jgi:hypothetical protein
MNEPEHSGKVEVRRPEIVESALPDDRIQNDSDGQLLFGFQVPEKKPEHANPLWWLIGDK